MRLDELMGTLDDAVLLHGDPATDVSAVELDSRQVGQGSIFCCIVGSSDDGHRHAAEAARRGAAALLTEHDVELPSGLAPAEIRVAPGAARHACAVLAAELTGRPADRLTLVGVTGTNGKTTVVTILSAILGHAGMATTVIGTLTGSRTTPPAPELHRLLAQADQLAAGLGRPGAVAMEVSSHALDQGRVDGLRFAVAVFTNLSHDHLDYHHTMAEYFEAKSRLFDGRPLERRGHLVRGSRRGGPSSRGGPVRRSLWAGTPPKRSRWAPTARASAGEAPWSSFPCSARFNVTNALLASEAAVVLGIEPAVVAEALSSLEAVRGRTVERRRRGAGDPLVLVDYAHTPDALEGAAHGTRAWRRGAGWSSCSAAAASATGQAPGDGSGGAVSCADVDDRDLGQPAARGTRAPSSTPCSPGLRAASVLATSSRRPRRPQRPSRRPAPGDVVLVAGKGHETTQDFGRARAPSTTGWSLRVLPREGGWPMLSLMVAGGVALSFARC